MYAGALSNVHISVLFFIKETKPIMYIWNPLSSRWSDFKAELASSMCKSIDQGNFSTCIKFYNESLRKQIKTVLKNQAKTKAKELSFNYSKVA